MATVLHKHIGEADCPGCTKPVPVKETAGGKIKVQCTWCDFSAYYHPGTIAHKNFMANVRLTAAPPAPAPAAAPAPAPAPAKPEPAPALSKYLVR